MIPGELTSGMLHGINKIFKKEETIKLGPTQVNKRVRPPKKGLSSCIQCTELVTHWTPENSCESLFTPALAPERWPHPLPGRMGCW